METHHTVPVYDACISYEVPFLFHFRTRPDDRV
jgi:hypothetical protein